MWKKIPTCSNSALVLCMYLHFALCNFQCKAHLNFLFIGLFWKNFHKAGFQFISFSKKKKAKSLFVNFLFHVFSNAYAYFALIFSIGTEKVRTSPNCQKVSLKNSMKTFNPMLPREIKYVFMVLFKRISSCFYFYIYKNSLFHSFFKPKYRTLATNIKIGKNDFTLKYRIKE